MPGPFAYILRHGQSTWNARGVLQGQRPDVPLTALGRRQAVAAADRLAGSGATVVLTSDLLRAVMTAEIVAERLRVNVESRAALREQCVGAHQGRSPSDVRIEIGPDAWDRGDWRHARGESTADVAARLRSSRNCGRERSPRSSSPMATQHA